MSSLVLSRKIANSFSFVQEADTFKAYLDHDRQSLLAAVRADGYCLERVAEEFKCDREVVLTAVASRGGAVRFASEEFKKDHEIVLAAVRRQGQSLRWVADELRSNREIILAAVTCQGSSIQFAPEEFHNDREVVLAAVSQSGEALQWASEEMRNDREVVRRACSSESSGTESALQWASDKVRSDREVVLAAVELNRKHMWYASEELLTDEDFLRQAESINPAMANVRILRVMLLSGRYCVLPISKSAFLTSERVAGGKLARRCCEKLGLDPDQASKSTLLCGADLLSSWGQLKPSIVNDLTLVLS